MTEERSQMLTWAAQEVEFAIARERRNAAEVGKPEDAEYGVLIYEAALELYKLFETQGHSGMSASFTLGVFNKLVKGQSLTPIEDIPEAWNEAYKEKDRVVYQCKRMSSLFKYVYDDGRVEYSDIGRWHCVDISSGCHYHTGRGKEIEDEIAPITFPYKPTEPYLAFCEDGLTDKANGDLDTWAFIEAKTPEGKTIPVNRFYKESEEGWVEISEEEYNERKARFIK